MPSISFVIPAYNEEKRISGTLNSYTKFLKSYEDYEIIVVCNGCTDNTVNLVKKFLKKNKRIKLLEFKEKIGKGGAVIEGFKVAKKSIIGFIDADDAFELSGLKKLIDNINDYDGVIASKWFGKKFSEVTEPFLRKVFSRGWNLLVRMLFGLKFKDTQSGAKFFRKEVIKKINKNFICRGFEFDVELLWRIKRKKFRIKEVYVPTRHTKHSTFSNKYMFIMFKNILKLRLCG
ncbi:MAG: glycosyltransferase [Nanoarchaeota archaeon]